MTIFLIIEVSSVVIKQIMLNESGIIILSTDEFDISLSFQRTIFSKLLTEYPRIILDNPEILSLPIGFFL